MVKKINYSSQVVKKNICTQAPCTSFVTENGKKIFWCRVNVKNIFLCRFDVK